MVISVSKGWPDLDWNMSFFQVTGPGLTFPLTTCQKTNERMTAVECVVVPSGQLC